MCVFTEIYTFVEKTAKACSVTLNHDDYISGIHKSGVDRNECEMECEKYPWCKGIQTSNSFNWCRLLTKENPEPISGWTFNNAGNWAEPDQWKNGINGNFKCYEKVKTGTYPI